MYTCPSEYKYRPKGQGWYLAARPLSLGPAARCLSAPVRCPPRCPLSTTQVSHRLPVDSAFFLTSFSRYLCTEATRVALRAALPTSRE